MPEKHQKITVAGKRARKQGSDSRRWRTSLLLVLIGLGVGLAFWWLQGRAGLPSQLMRIQREVEPAHDAENLIPIYLWDYSVWVDPKILARSELVLPYEKGPPEKLLPKIYFRGVESGEIELELNGKRPRTYSQSEIVSLFEAKQTLASSDMLARVAKETGLLDARRTSPVMFWLTLKRDSDRIQVIGVPWGKSPELDKLPDEVRGRFFFWGPGGSVFQVRCHYPCHYERMLELTDFPDNTPQDRRDWTAGSIQKALAALTKAKQTISAPDRLSQERLIALYLLSLISIDPRDPEAYFHLGKITHDRQTLESTIRYGRDLGMAPVELVELESSLSKL